jgi:uncharacterized membrane protein
MRNRRWLVVTLIVSLAVNLALAGFVAGRISRPESGFSMLDPSISLFRVIRELPEARRDEFRPTVREHFRAVRGDIRRMRRAQRGISQALASEPFEPDELDRSLHEFRAALLDVQQGNHRVLVTVAGAMAPEERQMLLEAMKRPHRSRGPHRRDRGHSAPR